MKKGQKLAVLREVRLRPKIGVHDFEAKIRSVKKMLDGGDKVKITVMFRGREITHADMGWKLLQKLMDSLKGVALIEKQPVMEGQRMHMILSPAAQIKAARPRVKEEVKKEEVKESVDAKT